MLGAFFFLLGAAAGSFSNVCIYRLPRHKSIVFPGSSCPDCGAKIKWFDNLPLVSFLTLKGKCRACQSPISARYFAVELLTAVCFLVFYLEFSVSPELFIFLPFATMLIITSFIDIEHRIIPDEIDLPGIFLGLAASAAYPGLHRFTGPWDGIFESARTVSILSSVSGIIAGGGTLLLIASAGSALLKKEAMGGGDIKLIAMIGAFLGWQLTFLTIFISALLGSLIGLAVKFRTGSSYIPYGPYLAAGAVISALAGERMIFWYFNRLIITGI